MAENPARYSKKRLFMVVTVIFLLCSILFGIFYFTMEEGIYPGRYTYDYQEEKEHLVINRAFSSATIRLASDDQQPSQLAAVAGINQLRERWTGIWIIVLSFFTMSIAVYTFKKMGYVKNFRVFFGILICLFTAFFIFQIFSYHAALKEVETIIQAVEK